jgi:putative oxidoreductase
MADNLNIAELLVRLFAGIVFMFQGYDKLFRIKIPGVVDAFKAEAENVRIPGPLLSGLAYYTSYVEFLGGFFLIFGFLTNFTLYALSLDLIFVTIAFSYLEPMWDMKHVFPRLLLLIALLLFPEHFRHLSLDSLLK